MAAATKNSKSIKINFLSGTIWYNWLIGYKVDWNINGILEFKIIKKKKKKKKQQNKVTVTYFVVTSPILLKCQYLEKTWMYFVQIWSQWSLNGTTSCLCKLTIQDGRQGLL